MNIEKIFKALEEDPMNSALGIIVGELENQKYKVSINGKKINIDKVFEGYYHELEKLTELQISLKKSKTEDQKFNIEFIDYHNFVIKKYSKTDMKLLK